MRQPRVPGLTWYREHPVAGDVVPVLALAVPTLVALLGETDVSATDVVVSVVVWLPVLARRRFPVATFAATAAIVYGSWAATGLEPQQLLPPYVAMWLALYNVANRCDGLRVLGAALVCEVVAIISLFYPVAPGEGPLFVPFTALTVASAVLGRNRRTRRAYTDSLEDRAARLERDQDQQARVAVAEERARIAREVHDVVAHNISVMIALADGATYASEEPRARAAMAHVATTGRSALTEMSRLLGVLRADDGTPSRQPAPGLADIETLVEQVRSAGLATELVVAGKPSPMGATAQLAVYRLVQEALTNTLKHARQARNARVELHWQPDVLVVDVQDDGELPAQGTVGHGITGMRERFGAWNGTVSAGPQPRGGWRVRAHLPIETATPTAPDSVPGSVDEPSRPGTAVPR